MNAKKTATEFILMSEAQMVVWFCQGSAILGQVEKTVEGDDTAQHCLNSAFGNNFIVKAALKKSRARLWPDSTSQVVRTRR